MSNEKLFGIILSISEEEDLKTSLEKNKINTILPIKKKKIQNKMYLMINFKLFII
mgnify:FL=1